MMRGVIYVLAVCFLVTGVVAQEPHFVVSQNGTGDFTSVQAAIDAVPDFRKATTIILVKQGTYKEKLILPASKINVRLLGEADRQVVITGDDFAARPNSFGEPMGTTGSSGFFVFGDGFVAENITFENTAGAVGQAVAVRVDSDRAIFQNCRFLGFQDTLYPHKSGSRQYYKNCYIEGATDFIFGWATAVFDSCELYCRKGGQFLTAASTEESVSHGFVFRNCRITGDAPEASFYLGRPWRPYAKTVFISCFMDAHIRPEGWHNWDKPDAEKSTFYAEYGSFGPGASTSGRVPWSHQLSEADLPRYSLVEIFDGWDPGTLDL